MTDLAAAETPPSGAATNPFAGRPLLADRRVELTATTLTADQRQLIAEQLTLVLEEVLVHRHQKKALYGVDVAPRLALLRREAAGMSDAAFHDEVCDIVNALRDGHTDYTAPGPRNAASVVLRPFFMVERCWIPGQDRWAWLATHLQGVGPEDTLTEGAELTHWNGVPIDVAIARNAEREWGNNPAARTARGAASMAGRRLRNGPLPDEDWVDVRFVIDGQPGETRLPWVVLGPQPAPAPATPSAVASPGTVLGVEERQRELHELTSRSVAPARRSARRSDDGQVVAEPVPSALDKQLAEAWAVTTPTGTFGHLRIYSFMPGRGPSDANTAMYEDLVLTAGRAAPRRARHRRARQRRRLHLRRGDAAAAPHAPPDRGHPVPAGRVRGDRHAPRRRPAGHLPRPVRRLARAGPPHRRAVLGRPAVLQPDRGELLRPDLLRPGRPRHGRPLLQRDRHLRGRVREPRHRPDPRCRREHRRRWRERPQPRPAPREPSRRGPASAAHRHRAHRRRRAGPAHRRAGGATAGGPRRHPHRAAQDHP